MDSNINISKITADLEKKFNGDANHDVRVLQDYCRTLPPCEESAKLVNALGKYAAEKFPNAEAFKITKVIEKAIAELEKQFNGDADHDLAVIREYCKSLPRNEDNFKVVIALGQYAASKYPEAEEIKKSKAQFEKMNAEAEKIKANVTEIQNLIKERKLDEAIESIHKVIDGAKLPEEEGKRFISFSHPFEEILFKSIDKDTTPVVRVSNLIEMLTLQLGSLLVETGKYDEARETLNRVLILNPISAPAHIQLAHTNILEKKFDKAFDELTTAYPLIYSRQMLCVFYCLLAEVVESLDKNYELAAAYAHHSLEYAENPMAKAVLERLIKDHNAPADKPSINTLRKLASEADLPVGPCQKVYDLAIQSAKQLKSAHPDLAKQIFAVAYDMTGEKALLKELR